MPDRDHAVNAKARATQMVKKGKLSKESKEKIDAKANKILGKAEKTKDKAGKVKDKVKGLKKETIKHEKIENKENKKHIKKVKAY